MNPFDEIAIEETVRMKEKEDCPRKIYCQVVQCGTLPPSCPGLNQPFWETLVPTLGFKFKEITQLTKGRTNWNHLPIK